MTTTTRDRFTTTLAVAAIAVVALVSGAAIASGVDILRFIPILSMLFVGGAALAFVSVHKREVVRRTERTTHDTGILG